LKKLTAIITLIMVVLMFTPGYAGSDSFNQFRKEITKQREESGRPKIFVHSQSCVVFIFALKNAMRKFKYDKITDTYKVSEIQNLDSGPSVWDQTPEERLQEALKVYGNGPTTE